MTTIDFHGYTVEQSIHAVDLLIGRIRTTGKMEIAHLITGHGVIRDTLLTLLRSYGLNGRLGLNNYGMIIVEIE